MVTIKEREREKKKKKKKEENWLSYAKSQNLSCKFFLLFFNSIFQK